MKTTMLVLLAGIAFAFSVNGEYPAGTKMRIKKECMEIVEENLFYDATVWVTVPSSIPSGPQKFIRIKEFHGIKREMTQDQAFELVRKNEYKNGGKGFHLLAKFPKHPSYGERDCTLWLLSYIVCDKTGKEIVNEGIHILFADRKIVDILK